jgi:hypothetical protein
MGDRDVAARRQLRDSQSSGSRPIKVLEAAAAPSAEVLRSGAMICAGSAILTAP